MTTEDEQKTSKIRQLNDEFRRSLRPDLGKIVMTPGVAELPELNRIAVVQKVRFFEDFSEANDPYGEHDFGSFAVAEETFYFKIDYFDENLEMGSEDPSDPAQTMRVLTLMKACEY